MTAETDRVTANYFKDFACSRHKYMASNKKCERCIFNCDTCSEKSTCDVCSVGFKLDEDKKKCIYCQGDEIYDNITKNCLKKVKDSDKLLFSPFKKMDGKKVSLSKKFNGPEKMGKMIVIQGQIFLKNYNIARNKMYELNTDPNYPDDNIEIVLIVNDIDMPASRITMRSEKSFIRDFYTSVPIPVKSKLEIKLRLSNYAEIDDYLEVRIKGYTFEDQTFVQHNAAHKDVENVAADIQVGNVQTKVSKYVKAILDNTGGGITDFEEVATRLVHINELAPEIREQIRAVGLDLTMALARCEATHGKCVTLYGTMAVKACPVGYERVGCCKCSLPCNTTLGYIEDGLFCRKPASYNTSNHKYLSLDECVSVLGDADYCELHGNKFYTKKCERTFIRSGEFDCLPLCPFGWPDYGDRCGKVGSIYCGMPCPW